MLASDYPSPHSSLRQPVEDGTGDDSDEDFSPEELSLVQELLTPERFLRVWAALQEPVENVSSKRQPTRAGETTTRWYQVLKQHHARCLQSSPKHAQVHHDGVADSVNPSSVPSTGSKFELGPGTPANNKSRQQLQSRAPSQDVKGHSLGSTATSAAKFSQRLSHAALSPQQSSAYDSSDDDVASPARASLASTQSSSLPLVSRHGHGTASPAVSAAAPDSARDATHEPESQQYPASPAHSIQTPVSARLAIANPQLAKPAKSMSPQSLASANSPWGPLLLELAPHAPSECARTLNSAASGVSNSGHAQIGNPVPSQQEGSATGQADNVMPLKHMQPSICRRTPAPNAATRSGQRRQHFPSKSMQQSDLLQRPSGAFQQISRPSSDKSQDCCDPQQSMPNESIESHQHAARLAASRRHGACGHAAAVAPAGRAATRGARRLHDMAEAKRLSHDHMLSRVPCASRRMASDFSDTDDDMSSEEETSQASWQRSAQPRSITQPRQQLLEEPSGLSSQQLTRQVLQHELHPQAPEQPIRHVSGQLSQQQSGLPAAKWSSSFAHTPSQLAGLAVHGGQEAQGDSPVCAAVSAVAHRLQAVQAGLANAEQKLAALSGAKHSGVHLNPAHKIGVSAGFQSDDDEQWTLSSAMQSPAGDAVQTLPAFLQRGSSAEQQHDPESISRTQPAVQTAADEGGLAVTIDAVQPRAVRRRLSMEAQSGQIDAQDVTEVARPQEGLQETAASEDSAITINIHAQPDERLAAADSLLEQRPVDHLHHAASKQSALSEYIEQQSQEQLERILQQQLLKQLQQQWQPELGQHGDLTAELHAANAEHVAATESAADADQGTFAGQHDAAVIPVSQAVIEVQSAALQPVSGVDTPLSASEDEQVSTMSARQRMQAALQAVHAAERAIDAAVVFRPRVQ